MGDTTCPYCGEDVEIKHDDGYGYNEGETYMQDCLECGNTFSFTTHVSYHYETAQAPCQNGEPHNLQDIRRIPEAYAVGVKRCAWCEEEIVVDKEASRAAISAYHKGLHEKIKEV